jgi:hypothetical protein
MNNKIDVINPGEKFFLIIVVPICANTAFITANPTNIYEKTGQSKPTIEQQIPKIMTAKFATKNSAHSTLNPDVY